MAVDFYERERLPSPELLTSDDTDVQKKKNIKHLVQGSCSELSLCFGTESAGVCGSTLSSGFTTPRGSELASTESTEGDDADDDFISELTRQMADYMLQEDEDDDDENAAPNGVPQSSKSSGMPENCHGQTLTSSSLEPVDLPVTRSPSIDGFYSNKQPFTDDQLNQHQPPTSWGRRGSIAGSSQHLLHHKRQQQHLPNTGSASGFGFGFVNGGRAGVRLLGSPSAGSGMRAIFLGGSGSRSGSSGTGVFLPSGTGDTGQRRKKSGCSTVLIPTRVLQALQPHFNRMDAMSHSNGPTGTVPASQPWQRHGGVVGKRSDVHSQESAMGHPEVQLPQEWTY